MFLILPFGVMAGYVTVALAYLLSKAGIPVAQVAALVAVSIVPHTWKFAWAPLVDTTLSRKKWYAMASVVSAAGILATGIVSVKATSLPLLTVVILVSNIAVTFLGMATESLMAYGTPVELKGRAGGWFQAGNLGGAGIGGGIGLWLAQRLPEQWMACAILAGACLLCCLGLCFLCEPGSTIRETTLHRTFANLFRDLWHVAKSRRGFLALFLCFLPIGSGAASNLWSAVAGDWHATADTVALVTGVLGGILSGAGCLIGGWICDRMDRKVGYVLYGVLQAACAVGMAFAPRTQAMYIFWTCLYAVITGLTYAGFTAFVLEAMGTGAAATKYNIFASLSNTPIYYMTLIDGWAYTRRGAAGMLNTEAAICILGMLLFVAMLFAVNRLKPATAKAS
ncbi:MAG TPA: MFS transporter [Candidatus Acidoferrales bacterium]|nr:MFS transporter [Candidatus Acidoferrales bacterium]